MRRRLAIVLAALALGASISSAFAGSTSDVVGRAGVNATNSSGVSGEAFIRQLASGRSHVTLRVSGLTPGTQPVWRVESGGTALITPSVPLNVRRDGTALAVIPDASPIPVGTLAAPNWIYVRVYAYEKPGGVGPQLASAAVIDLPSPGTAHWW